MKTHKVNRVEVIDYTRSLEEGGGRAYVRWDDHLLISVELQDDGKTLKVFISKT